jgi:hypothetical protein
MMTRGVMLDRHGRQLPVVNGAPAYPIWPSLAMKADPCNNVLSASCRHHVSVTAKLAPSQRPASGQ